MGWAGGSFQFVERPNLRLVCGPLTFSDILGRLLEEEAHLTTQKNKEHERSPTLMDVEYNNRIRR